MGRRRDTGTKGFRLPGIAVVLVAAALSASSAVAPSATSALPKRPNIVVLMTDDQTVESLRVMPNVKRLLVDRGATFENSFVSLSLCCPSRATFLTGQYAHNHGVLGNQPPAGGYEKLDGSNTLPVWLQRSGYTTVHLGKYLNGYGRRNPREIPPGWSEWHGSVDPSTYEYFGYRLNEDGALVRYGFDAASYQTDVYARKAVDIVRRRTAEEKPFFLWVAFIAPHSGGPTTNDKRFMAVPAPRHAGRFASELLPITSSFNELDVSDKPTAVRRRRLLTEADVAVIAERYRRRLASLLAVDEAVARIVGELKKRGELANTLIVFTSDNGFLQGEHRIPLGKVDVYEPSTRVPLVMRGPGIPAGVQLRQPVANIDLAPTIVETANAGAGLTMDGRSLWPILRDTEVFWSRDLLHEGPGRNTAARAFTALRTPRWLYAEYATGDRELYDLSRDPDELVNLYGEPDAATTSDELSGRLGLLRDCTAADCRRGAALSVTVRVQGACPGARAEVEVGGQDVREVSRARFDVDRQYVLTDLETPYQADVPLGRKAAQLRVHVFLADGRELTRDRKLEACS